MECSCTMPHETMVAAATPWKGTASTSTHIITSRRTTFTSKSLVHLEWIRGVRRLRLVSGHRRACWHASQNNRARLLHTVDGNARRLDAGPSAVHLICGASRSARVNFMQRGRTWSAPRCTPFQTVNESGWRAPNSSDQRTQRSASRSRTRPEAAWREAASRAQWRLGRCRRRSR